MTPALSAFLEEWENESPTVLVHTSGSTGQPKPLRVEKERMRASARMTCGFLGIQAGDTALLCMPLEYIAGKMMVVRAVEWGLRLVEVPPSGHPLASLPPDCHIDFAAMVPLQVWNSLNVPQERECLRRIRHLLIGGGAIDARLEVQLRDFPHHVWSTYGMTETLSHIALRRLSGPRASSYYTPLPDVSLGQTAEGCLTIHAPRVCSGTLETHDIVGMQPDGSFQIIGRLDNVICSGGIKLQTEQIEAALHSEWKDGFMITSVPDERLGEAVVLLTTRPVDSDLLRSLLPNPYWMPRHIFMVGEIPLTGTGKPDRVRGKAIAIQAAGRV